MLTSQHLTLKLTILALFLVASFQGSVQDVTDASQLKESDIIKITVEKKATTKALSSENKQRINNKTPLTIVPLLSQAKPVSHTAPPINMIGFEELSKELPKEYQKYSQIDEEVGPGADGSSGASTTLNTIEILTDGPSRVSSDNLGTSGTFNKYALGVTEKSQDDLEGADVEDQNMISGSTEFLESVESTSSIPDDFGNTTGPSVNVSVLQGNLTNSYFEDVQEAATTNATVGYIEEIDDVVENRTKVNDAENGTKLPLGESESVNGSEYEQLCDHSGNGRLQYVWGDAFSDTNCLGPNMQRYPSDLVNKMFEDKWKKLRHKREVSPVDPMRTRNQLLRGWLDANGDLGHNNRMMKSSLDNQIKDTPRCPGQIKKLCKSDYNTTAPIFGMSMTTGQPVAIVQKFPDLLQQVIYEVCLSDECAVVHGKCTNTYIPYLFLTIPLGPVTLTGQDYILVESGCSCKPDP